MLTSFKIPLILFSFFIRTCIPTLVCISKFSQNEDILHLCSHQIAQIAFESPFCALYFAPSKTKPSFLSHAGLFIKVPKTGNAEIDRMALIKVLPFDRYFVASCYKIMCTVSYHMCLHICHVICQRKRHEERSNQT